MLLPVGFGQLRGRRDWRRERLMFTIHSRAVQAGPRRGSDAFRGPPGSPVLLAVLAATLPVLWPRVRGQHDPPA